MTPYQGLFDQTWILMSCSFDLQGLIDLIDRLIDTSNDPNNLMTISYCSIWNRLFQPCLFGEWMTRSRFSLQPTDINDDQSSIECQFVLPGSSRFLCILRYVSQDDTSECCLTVRTWKLMVGKRSFRFGFRPILRCELLVFRGVRNVMIVHQNHLGF